MLPLRRHAFVRLDESSWGRAACESGDPGVLRDWVSRSQPLVVRRPCVSDDGRFACLGLALPGKMRHAFLVPLDDIIRIDEPPLWKDCRPPGTDWPDPGFRTFGSHAWKFLTGLEGYVTAGSDVDLIYDVHTVAEWETVRRSGFELPASPRVDLEIIFQRDASFSWREFQSPSDKLLIKSNRTIQLAPKDELPRFLL